MLLKWDIKLLIVAKIGIFDFGAEFPDTFGFGFDFSMAKATSGERKRQSVKVINTEYYVHDEFALLGTIGGYLGTAYGFSIWETAVPIINYIQRFIV